MNRDHRLASKQRPLWWSILVDGVLLFALPVALFSVAGLELRQYMAGDFDLQRGSSAFLLAFIVISLFGGVPWALWLRKRRSRQH